MADYVWAMKLNLLLKVFLACFIGAVVGWLFVNRELLDMKALVAWIAGFGLAGPLIFVAARSVGAVFFVPGSLMAITAGMAFGPVWGAVYNLTASTLGAMVAFLIARYLAADLVERKVGERMGKIMAGIEAEGWRFVAFVRLVPLFPYNVLNYALGVTRIKLSHFTWASLIFMIPGDIAYTYIGYAGREALAGNDASIEKGLLALGGLAALVFLPRLIKYFRKNSGPTTAPSSR
jgi:uncharacterized membrane protein YdjX (TVP38/TMEM64 family)